MSAPIEKYKAGAISAALWHNNVNVNGQPTTMLKASVERRYKDKNGDWKSSGSFSRNEIPLAIWALQRCFDAMIEKSNSEEPKVEEIDAE